MNEQHDAITSIVIGCAFDVVNELGIGFLELVYHNALRIAIAQKGLSVSSQHPISVMFRGEIVGTFSADLLVEGVVIVEIKAVKALAPEHSAQLINYLNATSMESGLLINFGNQKLEVKRLNRNKVPTT